MNASVLTPLGRSTAAAARAEHISIEADADYVADAVRSPHRKVRTKYALKSSMRKCSTELALLDEHYLQVHAARARKQPVKYQVDLRFLNSQPVRVRHIAWVWFLLSLALLVGAAGAMWLASSATSLTTPALIGACAAAACALGTTLYGVRSTSESLIFTSVHGGAVFVNVLGGPGSTKSGKSFFVAMIKDIAAAKAARPQGKQQWLRDEMREHHRLRELGVLSDAEYEASKARILKAHS